MLLFHGETQIIVSSMEELLLLFILLLILFLFLGSKENLLWSLLTRLKGILS